jgi:hypothetical protein
MWVSQPRAPWVGIGALALAVVAPVLAFDFLSPQANGG